MMLTWISAYYSRFEESTNIINRSSGRTCTGQEPSDENSEEVQIQRLFSRWDVTQSMIDDIHVVCCMSRTKEIVLDHLSR
jgi:ligand-binding sensor protein